VGLNVNVVLGSEDPKIVEDGTPARGDVIGPKIASII
jgi:hypothetical protein